MNTELFTDEQIDFHNQQLEMFKKQYSTIADIKAVIGKLDVLKLYTDNNFNDVVLKSLIEDCILSLNNTLGDDKHKPIRVIIPENNFNNESSVKRHEQISISKEREVQDIDVIADKYFEAKKPSRKPQIKKQTPVILPESSTDTDLGILRSSFPESSSISHVVYHTKPKLLYITFKNNGRTYKYKNVALQIYKDMLESDSVGRYVQNNIVKNYEYLEVTEEMVG